MKTPRSRPVRLRLRIVFDDGSYLGPGKADLLEGIRETGSIASAGRRLGMSYKRAWTLVETLNGMFVEPLVRSSRGGASQGGAALTGYGERVLGHYRAFEAQAGRAGADEISALVGLLTRGRDGMAKSKPKRRRSSGS